MKKRKLAAAILTAAALVMAICQAALAADETTNTENPTVDITKIYTLLNKGTTAPAQTFTFTVEKAEVKNSSIIELKDIPTLQLGDKDVTGSNGDNQPTIMFEDVSEETINKVELVFPMKTDEGKTPVGEYTYLITENVGNEGGIVYDKKKVYATVTVINDPNDDKNVIIQSISYKVDTTDGGKVGDGEGFVNRYQAGDLKITKTVTGNMGDKNKYFEIEVMLEGEYGKSYSQEKFEVSENLSYQGEPANPSSIKVGDKLKFYLKHGETLTIKNVPYNVTYTVKEKDYATEEDGYDPAKYELNGSKATSITAEKMDQDTETVNIINNKQTGIDTGVILDNLPYVLLLVIVLGAAVMLFMRRRTELDRE